MENVGYIYKNIAYNCFDESCLDMTEADRKKLFEEGDFNQIESYVHAKNLILAAAESIADSLEHVGYKINNLGDVVLKSQRPYRDYDLIRSTISRSERLNEAKKGEIALRALKSVHEQWQIDNEERFFDRLYKDEIYKFMPFWMLGFNEASKYYIFVRPILRLLLIAPEFDTLELKYIESQRTKFAHTLNLADRIKSNLTAKQLESISEIGVNEIASQVRIHNPRIFW